MVGLVLLGAAFIGYEMKPWWWLAAPFAVVFVIYASTQHAQLQSQFRGMAPGIAQTAIGFGALASAFQTALYFGAGHAFRVAFKALG